MGLFPSFTGKMPGKKYVNDGDVLCPKCGKTNTPSKDARKRGKVSCKRCGNEFTVAKE